MNNIEVFKKILNKHLQEANAKNSISSPVSLSNWRGTGRELADLLAEYLTDPTLTKFDKSDFEAEVYPKVTTDMGTFTGDESCPTWKTIQNAAYAVMSGAIPGLKDPEDISSKINIVSQNILKAICGFDPGFNPDDLSSGSLRGSAYGGIWELQDENDGQKFSDNWSDIYTLFHDNGVLYNHDLQTDLIKYGRVHRANVIKEDDKCKNIAISIAEYMPKIEEFFDLFTGIDRMYCIDTNKIVELKNFVEDNSEIFSITPLLVNILDLKGFLYRIGTDARNKLKQAIKTSHFLSLEDFIRQWKNIFGTKDEIDFTPIYRELYDKVEARIAAEERKNKQKAEEEARKEAEEEARKKASKQHEFDLVDQYIRSYRASQALDKEAEDNGAVFNAKNGRYEKDGRPIRTKTPDFIGDWLDRQKYNRQHLSSEELSDFLRSKGL